MRRRPVLLLVALAVLAGGCGVLGGDGGTYTVHAEFDRAFNLFVGSEVRVMGVAVGSIREVEFTSEDRWVDVEMSVRDDVALPEDVTARIVQGALLGERFVQFEPPHTGGPRLEAGVTIPRERTGVPAEFDEILSSLNSFLEDLPPDEVARLVRDTARVVDGRGEQLGQTIDDVATAVEVLRENDEEVVALASRLADLNETLATRDAEIGRLIEDWNGFLAELASERERIDAALEGVADLSAELGDLLATHRGDLTSDIRTLTRSTPSGRPTRPRSRRIRPRRGSTTPRAWKGPATSSRHPRAVARPGALPIGVATGGPRRPRGRGPVSSRSSRWRPGRSPHDVGEAGRRRRASQRPSRGHSG